MYQKPSYLVDADSHHSENSTDDRETSIRQEPLNVHSKAIRTSLLKLLTGRLKHRGTQPQPQCSEERKKDSQSILFHGVNGLHVITHHLLDMKGGLIWERCDDLAIYFTSWCHRHVSVGSAGSTSLKCYLE